MKQRIDLYIKKYTSDNQINLSYSKSLNINIQNNPSPLHNSKKIKKKSLKKSQFYISYHSSQIIQLERRSSILDNESPLKKSFQLQASILKNISNQRSSNGCSYRKQQKQRKNSIKLSAFQSDDQQDNTDEQQKEKQIPELNIEKIYKSKESSDGLTLSEEFNIWQDSISSSSKSSNEKFQKYYSQKKQNSCQKMKDQVLSGLKLINQGQYKEDWSDIYEKHFDAQKEKIDPLPVKINVKENKTNLIDEQKQQPKPQKLQQKNTNKPKVPKKPQKLKKQKKNNQEANPLLKQVCSITKQYDNEEVSSFNAYQSNKNLSSGEIKRNNNEIQFILKKKICENMDLKKAKKQLDDQLKKEYLKQTQRQQLQQSLLFQKKRSSSTGNNKIPKQYKLILDNKYNADYQAKNAVLQNITNITKFEDI